jgi:branched-chain amino acid transport system permease protein
MGVLSFGQMAFFGIGGYVYGILSINIQNIPGGTMISLLAGLLATGLVAGFFGYFVFYGQVSEWIIPVLTLVLTLVMETFMAQTAGYQWKVGDALLGGYNGMTNIPSLTVFGLEFSSVNLSFYYLVYIVCLLIYLGLRMLVNSSFGSVVVAIREDAGRTRTVGHNVNFIQVVIFVLSAMLAGLSGIFYVSWGNYIDPSSMGMIAATLPVVWVCVGGRQSFLIVIVSTLILGYLSDILSVYGGQYAFLVNGALLLGVMVFFPEGILMTLAYKLKGHGRRPGIETPVPAKRKPDLDFVSGKIQKAASSMKEPLLRTKGVTKSFGGVKAVDNLDFSIQRGELRFLIGPNGAGKSTFFNLLAGIYPVDAGDIFFKDAPITRLPPYVRVRKGISLKFQTARTFQKLTVAQNLKIPYKDKTTLNNSNKILNWALETFDLQRYMNVPVKDLSHGHRQWLEICLALATQPELLLLDEPTTGMTPDETSRTAEFVKSLNAAGISILVVEHDMTFVRQIASRVTVLHNGRFFAEGTLDEIESNSEVRRIYLGE